MKINLKALLAAACFAGICSIQPVLADITHNPTVESPILALHCGKLIDTDKRRVESDITILIQGSKITDVGSAVVVPAGAREIDLKDRYCAPGLIDTHTHLTTANENGIVNYADMTSASKTLLALRNAKTMLDMGFTTLRIPGDMDHHFGIIDLRNAINQGDFIGPRMFVAPHLLSPTGGHNDHGHLPSDLDQHTSHQVVKAGTDNAREAVRHQIKGGADWIKITASGGVMSTGDDPRVQGFTDEEIQAFAEETHRYGKKITGHVHGDSAAYSAAKARFDSIEHGTMITDKTISEMKKAGTYLVPTLYVLDWIIDQGVRDGITAEMLQKAQDVKLIRDVSFKKAYKAGIKIAFGTDQIFPHTESLNEFKSLGAQGVSNWDAIIMATINGADLLGKSQDFGSIAAGKYADIIALPNNPVEDTGAFEQVDFVLKAGRVVRQ